MNGWDWRQNWRESAEQITGQFAHSIAHSIDSRLPEAMPASIGHWSSGVQGALTQPIADWLQAHPLFAWGIDHPLLTLGLLLIVVLLLSGLIQAIARLTEQIWLWILRSPLLLMQRLLAIGFGWMRRKPAVSAATPHEQRLTVILQKLETMQQAQAELLQEVRALLAEDSTSP